MLLESFVPILFLDIFKQVVDLDFTESIKLFLLVYTVYQKQDQVLKFKKIDEQGNIVEKIFYCFNYRLSPKKKIVFDLAFLYETGHLDLVQLLAKINSSEVRSKIPKEFKELWNQQIQQW